MVLVTPREGRRVKIVKVQPVGIERHDKKWMATFQDVEYPQKQYVRYFGYRDAHKKYLDYTIGATDKQRDHYRVRHQKDVDYATSKAKADNDEAWLIQPGMLSMFILWGNSKDIRQNVRDFKKQWLGGAYLDKKECDVIEDGTGQVPHQKSEHCA